MSKLVKIGDRYVIKKVVDRSFVIQNKIDPSLYFSDIRGAEFVSGLSYAKKFKTKADAEQRANYLQSEWQEFYNVIPVNDSMLKDESKCTCDHPESECGPDCDCGCKDATVNDSYFRVTVNKGDNIFSSLIVKANSINEATSKYQSHEKSKGRTPERIVGIKEVYEDEVNEMKRRGMYVLDTTVKDAFDIKVGAVFKDRNNGRFYIKVLKIDGDKITIQAITKNQDNTSDAEIDTITKDRLIGLLESRYKQVNSIYDKKVNDEFAYYYAYPLTSSGQLDMSIVKDLQQDAKKFGLQTSLSSQGLKVSGERSKMTKMLSQWYEGNEIDRILRTHSD